MKFNYQARTREGEIQMGIVEAASQEAALSILQKYGLYVTYLKEVAKPPFYAREVKLLRGVSRKDIVIFSRQLSIMFKSGVPLAEALRVMVRQTSNLDFREKILKIAEKVEGGTALSQALQLHPREFSTFYVNMVKSGEVGGKLSDSLNYLADHLEREYNLQSKIQGAMVYPVFVLFLFLIIAVVMGIFVLPGLVEIISSTGQELSWLTKAVLFFSEVFSKDWWIIILVLFGLGFFFFRYFKTPQGKKAFDKYILMVPGIGTLFKKIYLSRFAENLSTLIAAGLPIAKALEVTSDVVGSEVYRSIILKTMEEVRKGEPISSVLERYPETVTPFFIQMTLVGEKSGQLDNILLNVVNFYSQDVDRTVESFTRLLEPILIIILGIGVGGFAVSILLPLYQTLGTF